ncbi:MAG: HEAT repeat domain-containing protein [Candidatus Thorarchaeota archaeon]
MSDREDKSKAYSRFEYYMFEMEDKPEVMLFTMIDMWIIDGLSVEEKEIAQGVLMASLEKKFDRRWVWALGEFETEEAYDFLLKHYNKENETYAKLRYADTLIWMNKDAPVLDYVKEILESDESVDIRMHALSVLYPLYDKEFSSEERRLLYLNMLFESMSDEEKRIRLYAYDMLKDHYGMKEFTPKNDPILKTLSENHTKEEYEKVTEEFNDKIKSIGVLPMTPKTIGQWIEKLPHNPPTIDIEECQICNTIPDQSTADMAAGESLDEYKDKLEVVIRFAYYKNCIMRCYLCGRFYKYEYEYEFLVPRSEEDEYLTRIDAKDIMNTVNSFLKFYDFKKIIICENFLKLTY